MYFKTVVFSVLLVCVYSIPLDLENPSGAEEGLVRRIPRSPKLLHHIFGGNHGGFGGHHGGFGGHHGGEGGHGGHGEHGEHGGHGGHGEHGGHGGHGGYEGPSHGGNYDGPHGGGGSFAGSAAFAGSGGHGGHGGSSQSQSASFAFGPFSASFSQSQAGGRGGPRFFDY